MSAQLHFAKNALALHLFLEGFQRLIDVVIANQYLHGPSISGVANCRKRHATATDQPCHFARSCIKREGRRLERFRHSRTDFHRPRSNQKTADKKGTNGLRFRL